MIDGNFNLRKILISTSPLTTSIFLIFLDSVPFYLVLDDSLKTQLGFIAIYIWIGINPDSIRPVNILIFGLLIDILNNFFFGFSTFFLSLVLFCQKKDQGIFFGSVFKKNWMKFFFFILFFNLCASILKKIFDDKIIISAKEFISINLISVILFPILFIIINNINKELKIYVE